MGNLNPTSKPLSAIYHFGDRLNRWLKKSRAIENCKIISVGNITAGGTGKTPAVIYLCNILKNEGYPIGILSRGYGGTKINQGAVVSDGKSILATPQEAGDEPYLMAENLSGIPVGVGKNRWAMGNRLRDELGSRLFVLDDGFQHYALQRNLDIVLLDAQKPFGNGLLLPHGNLRETPQALQRAGIIILTKSNLVDPSELNRSIELVQTFVKDKKIFIAEHRPVCYVKVPYDNQKKIKTEKLNFLEHEKVYALSGIANHRAFEKTLLSLKVHSVENFSFRDHYNYTTKDIEALVEAIPPFAFVVTTEKDWVRLRQHEALLKKLKNLYFLKIEFKITQDEVLLKKKILESLK